MPKPSLYELLPIFQNWRMLTQTKFDAHMTNFNGNGFVMGIHLEKFSVQSISKVLSLTLAHKIMEKMIWKQADVEPSGMKFDSLLFLEIRFLEKFNTHSELTIF